MNDEISLVKNHCLRRLTRRTRKVIIRQATSSLVRKLASRLFIFKMSERFVDVCSVDNFIAEQENKATLQKTQQDVKLLQAFLRNQE